MSFRGSSSIKYYPRLKIYKNSGGTCTFNPETCQGWSYYTCIVNRINGLVVFNDANFSRITADHRLAIRDALNRSGIKVDIFIESFGSWNECLDRKPDSVGMSAIEHTLTPMIIDRCIDLMPVREIIRAFRLKVDLNKLINDLTFKLEEKECKRYLDSAFKYHETKLQRVIDRLLGVNITEVPNEYT